MALVFPSSPTDGQVYTDTTTGNRYVYDAGKALWKYSANNVGVTVGTAPPPINQVAPGAMWYNTNTGRTFILYDDGDSKQWVENVPAVGSFDSSTVAGYANAAAVIAVAPAFNTANAGYTVANAAFGKANTALQNTSGTFAGSLATTGTVSSNGYVYITALDGGQEGGEIQLSGAGNYAGWSLDAWQNNHRVFVRTGSTLANINYFHALGGSVRMGVNKTDPLYTLDVSGDVVGSSSVRAPIFYDSNDTGYYVDPNSTSNLYRLNVNGSSIGSSGYTRLVNGMIIQWGSQSVGANARNTYNFPLAFPSGCYGFAATGDWDGNTGWAVCGGGVVSASQYFLFTVTDGGPDQIWWIAIGY